MPIHSDDALSSPCLKAGAPRAVLVDEVPATDLDMSVSGMWVQELMPALMNPPISLSSNRRC